MPSEVATCHTSFSIFLQKNAEMAAIQKKAAGDSFNALVMFCESIK